MKHLSAAILARSAVYNLLLVDFVKWLVELFSMHAGLCYAMHIVAFVSELLSVAVVVEISLEKSLYTIEPNLIVKTTRTGGKSLGLNKPPFAVVNDG